MKIQRNKLIIFLLFALLLVCNGCNSKKEPTTEQKVDSTTQKILDNELFLRSTEGMEFQISAWYFAKAFYNGDIEYIKNKALNPNDLSDMMDYNHKNQFSEIEYLIFRIHEYNIKTKSVYGEYVVKIGSNDACEYLEFRMTLHDGEWKIEKYSVDV